MDELDRRLGMKCDITRRDFLDGVARIAGSAAALSVAGPALPASAPKSESGAAAGADYPPMRQGMRGFDPPSMAAGHSVRDSRLFDPGADTGEVHDLVVVGSGMAGLAAAYFYRKAIPDAKVLVLEGCDDFGGHARRVEFNVDGRQMLVFGGTMFIEYPDTYSPEGAQLLKDIGVDRERYYRYSRNDSQNHPSRAMFERAPARFFGQEVYGIDRLVSGSPGNSPETARAYYDRTPLSEGHKSSVIELTFTRKDYMAGLSTEEKVRRLRRMSYIDYLTHVVKAHPDYIAHELRNGFDATGSSQAAGLDTISAWYAWRIGKRGFAGLGLPVARQPSTLTKDPGEHIHFPDGNGSVARLLVRWLIPGALPGSTMEDSISAHLQYGELDLPDNAVRIRLSSTVIRVKHLGDPLTAKEVEITYIRDGKPFRVRAGATVMACFNNIVPYLVPELPETQKAALRMAVRKPLLLAHVAVRNTAAFEKLGITSVSCIGTFFNSMGITIRPTWGGAYQGNPVSANEPAIVELFASQEVLSMPGSGLPPREQWKAARARLEAISFESLERDIRSQMERVLGPGGFSAKRDIAGITISRWGHGYAGGTNELYDPDWSHRGDAPWVVGRQRFGRIAISNSDAAATSLTQAAFAQSHRAVSEIINDIVRPVYEFNFSERDSAGPLGAWPETL